ncbi:MAG TPA: tetratricopeptide repeat protein, partial [Rubricoccaceae bacterium]
QAAGIPAYVGTLVSNERDQRPFVVARTEGQPDHTAAIAAAEAQVRAGQTAAGVAALRTLARQDTLAADAPFALGRALLAQGDTAAAAVQLRRARDLDALRFRAPTAFNAVIRRVAARRGAVVVETEAAFQRASPGGVVGRSLMLEHLHPNLDGYALLADTFLDALIAEGAAGPQQRPVPPGRSLTLITPMDSLAGLIRIELLTRSWPFRADELLPVDLGTVPPYVAQQAQAVLTGADWLPTATSLATWYTEQGDVRNARTAYHAVAQAYPFLGAAYVAWGNFEMAQVTSGADPSRLDDAVNLYEVALAVDPAEAQASMMLGALRLQAGDAAGAVPLLEQAAAGPSPPTQALYNLAGAYATLGRWDDAGRIAARLTASNPDDQTFARFAAAIQSRTLKLGP